MEPDFRLMTALSGSQQNFAISDPTLPDNPIVYVSNYKADGTPFWNQFFVVALWDAENNVVNDVGVQCKVSKAVVEEHMGEGKKK